MNPNAAFSCPRCAAAATPQPAVQTCPGCGGAFTLQAGVAGGAPLDLPTPGPGWEHIRVKSPGVVVMSYGQLDMVGIAEGNLDPILGTLPLDSAGVAYGDVVSIAVWRNIAWLDVVVAALLPVPIAAFLFAVAIQAPVALFGALPFALIAAVLLHRAFVTRACRARVAGRHRTITVRFDRPFWKRKAFHAEMFRRAGMAAPPLP
jgi:hypothetical protein